MKNFRDTLRKFDLKPSTSDDFRERTISGAIISVATISIMLLLFWSELKLFLLTTTKEDLIVDRQTQENTQLHFVIDFPYTPCDLIQVGYRDALGNSRADFENEIIKRHLDVNGNLIGLADKSTVFLTAQTMEESSEHKGHDDNSDAHAPTVAECKSCYGAGDETDCCNTCMDLINAYKRKGWDPAAVTSSADVCKDYNYVKQWESRLEKGCQVNGTLHLSKVQGHMFIVPGKVIDVVQKNSSVYLNLVNCTHLIRELSFGPPIPNAVNPFHNRGGVMSTDNAAMYQYFVNAVPTSFTSIDGTATHSYQVTETHHMRVLRDDSSLIPGVFFVYDFSPLRSVISETKLPLTDLLISLCSIMGGVFCVMGIVDSFVYNLLKKVSRKSSNEGRILLQKSVDKTE